MSKFSFQSIIISRIKKIAPCLKFIAHYDITEIGIKSCMHEYDKRSFIYLLTSDFKEKEYCIYVGKTKSQYARFLSHIKRFDFDHIYLFETNPENLAKNEALIIKELKPIYNKNHNPLSFRYNQILGIDFDIRQNKEKIQQHLHLKNQYEHSGLFGFSLNPAIYSMLETKAKENRCNSSEILQLLLEKLCYSDIAAKLKANEELPETNLINTIEYAKIHNCTRESVKQFLKEKDRICGAKQIGRDWVLPKDAHFPEDRRKKEFQQ